MNPTRLSAANGRPRFPRLWGAGLALLLALGAGVRTARAAYLPPLSSVSGSPRLPGKFVWADLVTHDALAAQRFYARLFGWTFRDYGGCQIAENTAAGRVSDFVLTSKGYARATVRTIPADKAEVRPTWLPFVRVQSVGECAAKARELGGKVLLEPQPELFDGKLAVLADPTGAAIGVMEWSESRVKGGKR